MDSRSTQVQWPGTQHPFHSTAPPPCHSVATKPQRLPSRVRKYLRDSAQVIAERRANGECWQPENVVRDAEAERHANRQFFRSAKAPHFKLDPLVAKTCDNFGARAQFAPLAMHPVLDVMNQMKRQF